MKTEKVDLGAVSINNANPRKISESKLKQLADSIMVLPTMLEIRPIVVDNTKTALGGNMRLKALNYIKNLGLESVLGRLGGIRTFAQKNSAEQKKIAKFWELWFDKPFAYILNATELTDAEKKEFIIKDNSAFGQWDYDMLYSGWDKEELKDWGALEDWQIPQSSIEQHNVYGVEQGEEQPKEEPNIGNLPPELTGIDITPDKLPRIEGTDEVMKERVIIVYDKEKAGELASLLGLEEITKVVYDFSELQ